MTADQEKLIKDTRDQLGQLNECLTALAGMGISAEVSSTNIGVIGQHVPTTRLQLHLMKRKIEVDVKF